MKPKTKLHKLTLAQVKAARKALREFVRKPSRKK